MSICRNSSRERSGTPRSDRIVFGRAIRSLRCAPFPAAVFAGNNRSIRPISWTAFAAIGCLGMTIVLRSLVGMSAPNHALPFMPWAYAIPVALFAGKLVGGILADRFGWHYFILAVLILSAPMIYAASYSSYIAIAGFLLFNMTMPVTLAAISNLLPGRPGFAFGLSALGVVGGAVATLWIDAAGIWLFALIAIAALLYHLGIKWHALCSKNS